MTGDKIRTAGRVAFLEHLAEIRKDLDSGWSLRAVWKRHKENVDLSERQFGKYVDRFIRSPQPSPPQPTPPAPVVSSPPPQQPPASAGPVSLPPPPELPKVGRLDPERVRDLSRTRKDDQ